MRITFAFPPLQFLLCVWSVVACSDRQPSRADVQPGASLTPGAVSPGVARDGTASPTPGEPPSLRKEGCEVRSSPGAGGPVTDPRGPYYHRVAIAHTPDGIHLSGATVVLEHASVPDGVKRADGSVLIYYVNGADHGVFVARVEGDTAVPIGPITLDGVSKPGGVVDPDATLLPSGTIRLAYMSGFGPGGGAGGWTMCLADSTDGVNFTVIGQALRFTDATSTDPSIVQLANGDWLMAVSQGQNTVLAKSADGLRYEVYATAGYGGVPEINVLPGGWLRLYVCAAGGLGTYISKDNGATWQYETAIANPIAGSKLFCDPSVVTGTDLFVFKVGE